MIFELWTADDKTLIGEFIVASVERAISLTRHTFDIYTLHFVKNIGE